MSVSLLTIWILKPFIEEEQNNIHSQGAGNSVGVLTGWESSSEGKGGRHHACSESWKEMGKKCQHLLVIWEEGKLRHIFKESFLWVQLMPLMYVCSEVADSLIAKLDSVFLAPPRSGIKAKLIFWCYCSLTVILRGRWEQMCHSSGGLPGPDLLSPGGIRQHEALPSGTPHAGTGCSVLWGYCI